MMCHLHHSLRAVLVCVGLVPVAGYAMDQPHCYIDSVQLEPLTKSLPMDVPQYVEGRVDVMCSSTDREPLLIEFGLFEVDNEPLRSMPVTTSKSTSSDLKVDLFSDNAGHQVLPLDASGIKHYSKPQMLPGSRNARLSIPFYARVVAQKLVGAGEYKFTRGIGLHYRVSLAL